ncbi:SEC-C metal-binding domain-containing protein [Neobacillus muris]|uniref:SEC-C metal-binding domain-containing protein n=1 Tax=Neobacillus muris TaxID=2941334 RepID=UPI00203CB76F|nr:SEC-C metal-binding domain-containing protein [Neobacillus muris]
MAFIEKIKPHLTSDDLLIQQTVLHALHEYPLVPEEWTVELLKEAFKNKDKLSDILIYVDHQKINEDAAKLLIEKIPTMDKTQAHLAIRLLDNMEIELALQYKQQLKKYINQKTWELYELIQTGTKETVCQEYRNTIDKLERANSFQHDQFEKAKKLAKCMVDHGWMTADEIGQVIQKEVKEQWFSFNGILTVYMIGLMKLDQYIPTLAGMLTRDEDVLLEEVADVLIRFQSDEVVKEVAPYLKKSESIIFASSVVENIKSEHAILALREAYQAAEELEDQDMLIEALCHQFSKQALPDISAHMENEYFSSLVDIEQVVYGYFSIIGEQHPDMEYWKQGAMEREMDFRQESGQGNLLHSVPVRNDNKVGRNDHCPCGSGKKYKKCCGK